MHNIKYILIALISIGVLNAQTISGTVSDSDGNSLMGANVSVEGTDLGSASNNDGSYSVTGLSAGTYTVTASYIGLENASSTVTVGDGQTVTVNLSLDKGDIRLNQVVVAASKKKELVTDAPASVEVFSNEELTVRNTTSIAGHTEGRAGVETMKTGMESSNVTVRGFNGVFSGAMNVIVDNRWARPPVITANLLQLIGYEDDDIDRIELVRGAGSTMYGPNSAQGVMAIYTKSPFDQSGTRLTLTAGERNYMKVTARHAMQLGSKFAMRVSLRHSEFEEWPYEINTSGGLSGYSEPATVRRWLATPNAPYRNYTDNMYNDPEAGIANNAATEADPVKLSSDQFSMKMEIRPDLKSTLTINLRGTESDAIEMTGIGRAYALGGQSLSEQISYSRQGVLGGDLFLNLFNNHNVQEGTYILATGQIIYDKSSSLAFQMQHTVPMDNGQFLVWGIDHEDRSPDTQMSINGMFEDDDDFTQTGAYMQYENRFNDKWKMVLAGRVDDNTYSDDLLMAPRYALVYNPNATSQVRFTYNKAYELPGNYPKNLDIVSVSSFLGAAGLPDLSPVLGFNPDFNVRAIGAKNGYNYNRSTNGLAQFRSNWSQHAALGGNVNRYYDLNDPAFNAVVWPTLATILGSAYILDQQTGGPSALLAGYGQAVYDGTYAYYTGVLGADAATAAAAAGTAQATAMTNASTGMQGVLGTVPTLAHVTAQYSPAAGALVASDGANVTDIPKNKATTRNQIEIGYKGQVAEGMVLGVDLWTTEVSNYISALSNTTHNVIMAADAQSYVADIMTAMAGNSDLAAFVNILDAAAYGGNGNGTGADEVAGAIAGGIAGIPVGSISPNHHSYGGEMIFGYRAVEEAFRLSGMDLSWNWYPSSDWSFWSSYSFINKDEISVAGVNDRDTLHMNTPKHKLGGGFQYKGDGHGYGLQLRWQDSYTMDGSVYYGKVESFYTLGVNASWDVESVDGMTVGLTVDNITDQVHREAFQGALMGRWASLKMGYDF